MEYPVNAEQLISEYQRSEGRELSPASKEHLLNVCALLNAAYEAGLKDGRKAGAPAL